MTAAETAVRQEFYQGAAHPINEKRLPDVGRLVPGTRHGRVELSASASGPVAARLTAKPDGPEDTRSEFATLGNWQWKATA